MPVYESGTLTTPFRFVPPLHRNQIAVLAWLRKGGYVSHERQKQKDLSGELPTIEDSVRGCATEERATSDSTSPFWLDASRLQLKLLIPRLEEGYRGIQGR
jgi:hypothetical protein